jgi:phosphoglycerate kinase
MPKLQITDLPIQNKRVLVRVDYNVPIHHGVITDDSRIKASLPTLQYILDHGGSLILMSHLGRPKGKKSPEYSLAICAKRLSEYLKKDVIMAPDCVGKEVEKMASALKPGQILMLENLRFHEAEEEPEKDPYFAEQLEKLGDLYVNDAFGSAHRAHSSTAFIAKYFPQKAAMGFLMKKEISALSPLLQNPEKPFCVIIGGAKISTKIGVVRKMVEISDMLFIGGAMAFTFFKAQGISVGNSLCEDPELIKDLDSAKLHLPIDVVIAESSDKSKTKIIDAENGIPDGWEGMDIGPKTTETWTNILQKASTVFWNGPLGVFEIPEFSRGTKEIATCLSQNKGKVIIGGGDSLAAIETIGLSKKFTHLSTGGGASLELLEFGSLPGIDALSNK